MGSGDSGDQTGGLGTVREKRGAWVRSNCRTEVISVRPQYNFASVAEERATVVRHIGSDHNGDNYRDRELDQEQSHHFHASCKAAAPRIGQIRLRSSR